ncbi:putative glycerol-3-phosphate transporter 1 [Wolffia australiana]
MGSLAGSTVPEETPKKPVGIRILESVKKSSLSYGTHQALVIFLTFIAYAGYHATRKTTSIVKSVLDPNSAKLTSRVPGFHFVRPLGRPGSGLVRGWAPFDGSGGTAMLGGIDVAFLSVYSLGMYFAGHLGDRLDLRIFLTAGMAGTGLFTALFGAGYWLNIHSFYYYLGVQMLAGLCQSTGWPSVVAVMGNWFGKKKRGLIMGLWNAHTSVGNIAGSLVAAAMLRYGWGWSFAVPGAAIAGAALLVFFFLPVSPLAVGSEEEDSFEVKAQEPLLGPQAPAQEPQRPVGFLEAWRIPGVAPFAFCLFFSKLVAYTFLYWLPFYISHTEIAGEYLSDEAAGNLSTLFDVGGVVGGILAGHVSDRFDARAIVAAGFTYCAIPALYLYRSYGSASLVWNSALMFVAGMFVNGPYALITTAVSADLGTKGGARSLATVTAIIDGTGSVGAALGPLLTGYVSTKGWSHVFNMLMVAAFVAGLLLTRLVVAEVTAKISARGRRQSPGLSRDKAVAEV